MIRPRWRVLGAVLAVAAIAAGEKTFAAASQLFESVRVTVPAVVLFGVTDVTAAVEASGGPTMVAFADGAFESGRALRISVKADGDLMSMDGVPVPASSISWTASSVSGGIGIDGVLSKTAYTPVFESQVGATSGRLNLAWRLSLPQGPLHAGSLQATLRWKFETIVP